MPIYHATKESFEKIKESGQRALIDFYAEWCGPCKMLAPILEELSKDYPDLIIAKINVDELPEIAIAYGIQSIPTVILMENGEVVKRAVGFRSKEQLVDLIG